MNDRLLTRLLADQESAPASVRILKNGTRHEVGPLSALDVYRYTRAAK